MDSVITKPPTIDVYGLIVSLMMVASSKVWLSDGFVVILLLGLNGCNRSNCSLTFSFLMPSNNCSILSLLSSFTCTLPSRIASFPISLACIKLRRVCTAFACHLDLVWFQGSGVYSLSLSTYNLCFVILHSCLFTCRCFRVFWCCDILGKRVGLIHQRLQFDIHLLSGRLDSYVFPKNKLVNKSKIHYSQTHTLQPIEPQDQHAPVEYAESGRSLLLSCLAPIRLFVQSAA